MFHGPQEIVQERQSAAISATIKWPPFSVNIKQLVKSVLEVQTEAIQRTVQPWEDEAAAMATGSPPSTHSQWTALY